MADDIAIFPIDRKRNQPPILEAIKALDRLEDTFDRGFDALAARVEALPTGDCPQYPEHYTDGDEDNEVDHLTRTLLDLHLTFRNTCRLLRQALLSSSTK